ncbi:DUF3558 family protein [Nonomuraea sp. LP-02]|uniref:DUF3558 family protein n=1 Tax=Nonomuraea sp. LP-02 TaxID=3097960 RepID=UPI002E379749|nr:DUF3558 family protein [Nonomuraea sp. LP-02]MED7930461.1 DUF3558 family protein [Nonomuraea sp. LP-02]
MITDRAGAMPAEATTPTWRNAARLTTSACAVSLSVVLLASCSPVPGPIQDPGQGLAATRNPATATATPAPSSGPADAFAGVDPCGLVPHDARTRLGLTDPRDKQVGQARVCRFRIQGATLRNSYTVGVELFSTRGLEDIVAARTDRLADIGHHRAVRFEGANGGCAVALGVGDRSRVDVTAVGGDLEPACDIVARLAAALEPSLP